MELKVICTGNLNDVEKNISQKYYSIISEINGPMIAIFSGRVCMQEILFGGITKNKRIRVTRDLLEEIKGSRVVSEAILFPHDHQFFLQKNKDGTLTDIRDGYLMDL